MWLKRTGARVVALPDFGCLACHLFSARPFGQVVVPFGQATVPTRDVILLRMGTAARVRGRG